MAAEVELFTRAATNRGETRPSKAADKHYVNRGAEPRKAGQGNAPAGPALRHPVRARKPVLAANISVGSALARVGGDCLAQIGANAQSVEAGVDGEFVHQARVGVRRLRSLLKLVEGSIGSRTTAPVVKELQWLSTALAAARDWDVFATGTLATIGRSLEHPQSRRDVGTLRGQVTRLRNAHFADAGVATASPRLQRLLLAAGTLLATLESPAADAALRTPARAMAKEMLERRARRLGKRGTHFRRLTPTERHDARIAAKKLRYVAELFSPLFPGPRTRDYLSVLGKLQEALGALNDLATAERLLDEFSPHARTRHLVHGAGIVRGWLTAAERHALADADRARRKFAKAKPFWR
jgi:CHAD domain-containing protein